MDGESGRQRGEGAPVREPVSDREAASDPQRGERLSGGAVNL